jgi:DNA-binding transcriptional LysR family regulator
VDIHHLRVFSSVFKNRSFTRASEELNITQPTVSEHIKSLEEELGVLLFDRVGRQIIPTQEAELFYTRAVEIIEKLQDIKTGIGQLKGEVKGQLTIGASTIPGTYIIPTIAAEFKRRYAGISFQVIIEDSKKITDMLIGHELILGIVGAKMDKGKLEYQPFIDDELVLAAPPGMIRKKTMAPGEIARIPFILREEGSGTRKTMLRYLSEEGIGLEDLNVSAVLGSTDSVKEAIKSGLGASILSRCALREELSTGSLVVVGTRGLRMKRSFYIVTHRRRALPAQYRAFLEHLTGKIPAGY